MRFLTAFIIYNPEVENLHTHKLEVTNFRTRIHKIIY